jgi:hypothetical protein
LSAVAEVAPTLSAVAEVAPTLSAVAEVAPTLSAVAPTMSYQSYEYMQTLEETAADGRDVYSDSDYEHQVECVDAPILPVYPTEQLNKLATMKWRNNIPRLPLPMPEEFPSLKKLKLNCSDGVYDQDMSAKIDRVPIHIELTTDDRLRLTDSRHKFMQAVIKFNNKWVTKVVMMKKSLNDKEYKAIGAQFNALKTFEDSQEKKTIGYFVNALNISRQGQNKNDPVNYFQYDEEIMRNPHFQMPTEDDVLNDYDPNSHLEVKRWWKEQIAKADFDPVLNNKYHGNKKHAFNEYDVCPQWAVKQWVQEKGGEHAAWQWRKKHLDLWAKRNVKYIEEEFPEPPLN